MHDRFREKGLPEAVELVTADVAGLPLEEDGLDAAYSTMTRHEFASEAVADELARAVRPGGRLVTVDWSSGGEGDAGPPVEERYGPGHAVSLLSDAGFAAVGATERRETFVCVARR